MRSTRPLRLRNGGVVAISAGSVSQETSLIARKELAGVLDRFDELVFENRRRAAADVHGREVVAQRLDVLHLLAQIDEVLARLVLLEKEPVEGAVRAQRLAERNVRVEHVLVARLGFGRTVKHDGVAVEVAADVVVHDAVGGMDHPVGKQFSHLKGRVLWHVVDETLKSQKVC